ncbi:MAG TPA: long-chain-fatty-acid--CoA ligase [Candidatus Sulfotelmatobacter sp.]|nr:long-chain-fatty-acid--CoA ligase [Candidatus Sulfotelmatobacter sp.]
MNIPLTPIRFLRYAEQQFANRIAVVCQNHRYTYTQFSDRVGRLAGALRVAGVQAGDRVAFLSFNCHRLLEAYYGVLEAGAVLLPLNYRLAPHELAYVLNDSGATVVFATRELLGVVDSFRNELKSVRSFHLLDAAPEEKWLAPANYEDLLSAATPYRCDVASIDENSLAELFYTSGTSTQPKGVMLTHRNIYLHALQVTLHHHTKTEDTYLHTIPLFHANGWGAAHTVTSVGAKHVMIQRFIPQDVFRLIEQERVYAMGLVPIMAAALVNCPERTNYDLRSLQWIAIGGAASSPAIIRESEEKLGCKCFSGYGLTETSPSLAIAELKPDVRCGPEQRALLQSMTGYAFPGTELRVVDADDRDVPHDGKTMGEIIARSDGVMAGYWNQPEATAEALRGGWFRTGDIAVVVENGYILITDRKKDIIVSGGENISSLEVEKTLSDHPAIYEVAVIAMKDEKWGEVPMAVVVLRPGCNATESELIEFCRARLAHYKCPRAIEFCDTLPKTATGKVLRKELRQKYWGQATLRTV